MQSRIPAHIVAAMAALAAPHRPDLIAVEIDARLAAPTEAKATPPPRFVSQKAACAALGICRPTLLKMRQSGQLKTVQVGSRVLVPQAALEALAACKVEG